MGDDLDQIIGHPIRADLIRHLWHRGGPVSALSFQHDHPDLTLGTVSYHVRVLERDGIARLDREDADAGGIERFVVLDGPNSGEAIRRLQLK